MTASILLFSTFLVVVISAKAFLFAFRYFTSSEKIDLHDPDHQLFALVAALSLIFAGFLQANDIIGYTEAMFMRVYPFEHQFSLQKTELNFFAAGVSCLIAQNVLNRRKPLGAVPAYRLVLLLASALTLGSLFFRYISTLGYCCESPTTVFIGFPFSAFHGIIGGLFGLNYTSGVILSGLSLIDLFQQYSSQIFWQPHLFALLLNLLFWANIIYLLLIPFNLLRRRFHSPTRS